MRGNHGPFITTNLRKAIYIRRRLKNKFTKNPSEINEKLYKRQLNKCVSIKLIKKYFSNIKIKSMVAKKEFWETMITNQGCLDTSDIMLRDDNEMINDDKRLTKRFNNCRTVQ